MHAFRIFLIVVVVLVATSEGFGLGAKKALFKKVKAVKLGFLADAKEAALKFKEGAKLKKDAILGSFKALAKAKLGVISGIKSAKLRFLAGIASVKLAKLAAVKAAKVTFFKSLLAAKVAENIVFDGGAALIDGAKSGIKGLFKDGLKGDLKSLFKEKKEKSFLEGIGSLLGGGGGFGGLLGGNGGLLGGNGGFFGGAGGGNPFGSIFGNILLNAFNGGIGGRFDNRLRFDLGDIVSGISGLGKLPSLIPTPNKPAINIQTYQLNSPPSVPETYEHSPTVYTSYSPSVISYTPQHSFAPEHTYSAPEHTYSAPVEHTYSAPVEHTYSAPVEHSYSAPSPAYGPPSHSYSPPSTSYGTPEY